MQKSDGASLSRGAPCVSFCDPDEDQMSIAGSESVLLSSVEDDEVELLPLRLIVDGHAFPSRRGHRAQVEPCGLMIGSWVWRGSQPSSAQVPFFPEVHEEVHF